MILTISSKNLQQYYSEVLNFGISTVITIVTKDNLETSVWVFQAFVFLVWVPPRGPGLCTLVWAPMVWVDLVRVPPVWAAPV